MWYRGTPRLHAFQLRDQILGARVLDFRFVHKFFVVDMFAHRRIEVFPLDLCSHRELRADLCDDRSLLPSLPSSFNLLICFNSDLLVVCREHGASAPYGGVDASSRTAHASAIVANPQSM
jgi:hypothetical protein